MANIELDAGSGGSIVRTVQKTVDAATVQIATAAIDVGDHSTGSESLVGNSGVFMPVHGAAGDDAAAAGNPILVGAKYLSSPESNQLDANDVGQLICDINRHLKVVIHGAGGSSGDPSVGLAIDDDGAASVSFSGLQTENYRTDGGGTDTTAAFGVLVPGSTGAVSVGSVSVTNKTGGSSDPTVVGLNSAVVGAHITDFYTGDTPDDDVVNIAAFGLAIPSASGPVVIDNASNKLSVDVSTIPDVQIASAGNTVKLEAATTPADVIGTVKISTADNTVQNKLTHIGTTAVAAGTGDVNNGTQRVVIASDDTNLSAITTAVELVAGAVQTDTISIAGRTTIETPSSAKALLVDANGHLQVDVLSGGGNSDYVYADDADWTAESSKHALIGGVYQATRGSITDGDTGPVRLTSTGQVHAYLDDVTYTANSAITTPDSSAKVSMSGAVVDNDLTAATPAYSDGDAAPLKVTQVGALHVKPQQDADGALGNVGIIGRNDIGLASQMDIDVDENKASLTVGDVTIYGISAFNSTDSPIYLKFWDQGVSTVTVGSTTPKLTFLIPANSSSNGAGFVLNIPQGIFFDNQVVWAATTGVDASSSSGPATNGCILNFFYQA